jgi:hypothetical protein
VTTARVIALCLQELKGEVEYHHKLKEAEAKEMCTQQLEYLAAGARSLKEALKHRSTSGMAEAYKEPTIRLDKFKANMEGTTSGSVNSTSLQKM